MMDNEKTKASPDLDELSQRLSDNESLLAFFKEAIGSLLIFIKQFSLDLQEINADAFKKEIDVLSEKFNSEEKVERIASDFENRKKNILKYIQKLERYVGDREKEFKGIIDILIKAMATLDSDNQDFHQKIYQQSEEIEKITLLDDIKKIKSSLESEISKIRETIKEKQARDKQNFDRLSSKVDVLNVELKKAKNASLTDGLTGAYNRQGFDRLLTGLVERNKIAKTPFCLLFIDIDNFKEINDQYGHPIGDRVLLALVQKCNEETRKDDFVARLGGDEFAVIMAAASLRNAIKKGRQLCRNISGTRYSVTGGEDARELSFSISIGISEYRIEDTVDEVIARADKALYAAKHSGKARVSSEKEIA